MSRLRGCSRPVNGPPQVIRSAEKMPKPRPHGRGSNRKSVVRDADSEPRP